MQRCSILFLVLGATACVADDPTLDTPEARATEAAGLDVSPMLAEAHCSDACPAATPAALAPPADQDLAFVLDATGTQNYTCNGTAWVFVAPEARLFRRRHDVGHHYAGPSWEYQDGSIVVGAKTAGATVDATAIPWLLLSVPSHAGPEGKMTEVTAIQRLSTAGGLAPATGCDADHVGATADVAYTATYFFYRTHASHPERNTRCGAP